MTRPSSLPDDSPADDSPARVVRTPDLTPWTPLTSPGGRLRVFARSGDDAAPRLTGVAQYEKDSRFGWHGHDGGEEILVLDGQFSDEYGEHPAGTYLRHPPGTTHSPVSHDGCTVFVRLRQFLADDHAQLRVDTRTSRHWQPSAWRGMRFLPLHEHGGINVALVRWAPNASFIPHGHPGGEEIFVIEGLLLDEHGQYPAGSWLRSGPDSQHTPYAGPEGALIYLHTGSAGANIYP